MSKTATPYRALPVERRVSLVTRAMQRHKASRLLYAQRIAAKGGGFRAATLASWPPEKLAREFVRLNAQAGNDELELLQLLYVDLEPEYQVTFLEACGVAHENGVIPEALEPPYASAEVVAGGVAAVLAAHGDAGRHYLETLVVYNLPAWPGLDAALEGAP